MYYLNARMYDPAIARFIQEDTYRGTINDPLSLNLYTYCANNPLIYHDPTGHAWETIFDIASIGASALDLFKAPSLKNLGYLAWDVGSTLLPGVPGSYVSKGTKAVSKVASKFDNAVSALKSGKLASKFDDAVSALKSGKNTLSIKGIDDFKNIFKTTNKSNDIPKLTSKALNSLDNAKNLDRAKDTAKALTKNDSIDSGLKTIKNLDADDYQELIVRNSDGVVGAGSAINRVDDLLEIDTNSKVIPNPNGKKGAQAHQNAISRISTNRVGGEIRYEVRFDTPNGAKNYRYADAVEVVNGEIVSVHQVAKVGKNGMPVVRESRAIEDIITSPDYNGAPVYFWPYNSNIGPIIY